MVMFMEKTTKFQPNLYLKIDGNSGMARISEALILSRPRLCCQHRLLITISHRRVVYGPST